MGYIVIIEAIIGALAFVKLLLPPLAQVLHAFMDFLKIAFPNSLALESAIEWAYNYVVAAEDLIKTLPTGQAKFDYVTGQLMQNLGLDAHSAATITQLAVNQMKQERGQLKLQTMKIIPPPPKP